MAQELQHVSEDAKRAVGVEISKVNYIQCMSEEEDIVPTAHMTCLGVELVSRCGGSLRDKMSDYRWPESRHTWLTSIFALRTPRQGGSSGLTVGDLSLPCTCKPECFSKHPTLHFQVPSAQPTRMSGNPFRRPQASRPPDDSAIDDSYVDVPKCKHAPVAGWTVSEGG
jgi:hypothetical protein